jgi:subtilisin
VGAARLTSRPRRHHAPLVASLSVLLCALALAAGPADAAPNMSRGYIVVFRDGVTRPAQVTRALERARGFSAERTFRLIKGFSARLTPAQAEALRRLPEVAFVDPERTFHAAGSSYPLAAGETTSRGQHRIEAVHEGRVRGPSGARVAVLDTGLTFGLADLNAVNGKNCLGSGKAHDDKGHGTSVAGTIAARNNGSGLVGTAPGTRLVAVKVLDSNLSGTTSAIICGVEWVTSTLLDSDPANDVRVANISFFGEGPAVEDCSVTTDALHRAICASAAAGVTYVVAAGNGGNAFDNPARTILPAAYPEVLTVTAMADGDGRPGALGGSIGCRPQETDDHAARLSNYASSEAGAAHTIAAPGICIRAIMPNGEFKQGSGTTQSTPHVAGAVALCIDDDGTPGPCAGMSAAEVIAKMRADAEAANVASPSYGFFGDPLRPVEGRYYGYLVRVGIDPRPPDGEVPPSVVAVLPADGAVGQPTSTTVSVSFSETMDQAATQAAFSLRRASDNALISGQFSWSGNTMTFQPTGLAEGTVYRARVDNSARTATAAPMSSNYEWSFRIMTSGGRVPFGVSIQSGSKRSGGFRKLAFDDNVHYEVNSTAKAPFTTAWFARFADVPRDVMSLTVAYGGRNTRACSQAISIYRWETGAWVQVDLRSVGKTEVAVRQTAPGTLAQYVGGSAASGEVRLRVSCATNVGRFYARGDYMQLLFTRP